MSEALDIHGQGLYTSYDYESIMESQQLLLGFSKPLDSDLASQKVAGIPLNQGAKKCVCCNCFFQPNKYNSKQKYCSKPCKKKVYKVKYKDDKKGWDKKYYQQNKLKILDYQKLYYINNKDKVLETNRQWVEKNKEKYEKYKKDWAKNNRGKINENRRKYWNNNINSIKEKDRLWKNNNKDKIARYREKWEVNGKDYTKKYYQLNSGKIKDKSKKYAENNKEKIKRYKHNYAKNNRIKLSVVNAKRRALKKSLLHTFTEKQWQNKLHQTNGFCPRCSNYFGTKKLTLDHIMPISKAPDGFIYTIDEIQPLCLVCNVKKFNKIENATINLSKKIPE